MVPKVWNKKPDIFTHGPLSSVSVARGITYLQFSKRDYAKHASSFPSLSGLLPPFLHYLLPPFLLLFPLILLPYPLLFSLPSSFLSFLSSSLHSSSSPFPLLSLSWSLWWCQPQPLFIPYPYSSSGACIEVHSVMWDRKPCLDSQPRTHPLESAISFSVCSTNWKALAQEGWYEKREDSIRPEGPSVSTGP